MLVALAMTLTSASVVFADGELVTSVKYKDGFVTVTGETNSANEAVDIFLLNPGETLATLGTADTTAEYNKTVNFSDVIYSDAAKAFEITFEIKNQKDKAAYLLYVKAEDGEDYSKTVSLNNIYVAVDGDDTNGDGTEKKPFKTIARAQTAARAALKDNPGSPTNVIIGEGTYTITSGLAFTSADNGTAEAPVTYKAAESAKVVVSGATQIPMDKISPLTDADSAIIARLPEAVANKVVKVDLSNIDGKITGYASNWSARGRLKPMGVYLNDDYQDISRWPNTGYVTITAFDKEGPNYSGGTTNSTDYASIIIKDLDSNRINGWSEKDKVFIDGYIGNQWFVESAKMGTISKGFIGYANYGTKIQLPHATQYGIDVGGRVILKNILEEIDSPGEWYVDETTKTMYYYPPHTLTSEDTLEITTLTQNFVTIDGASNFAIEGITFEKNSNAENGNGIEIKNGDNITIKDCTMKDLGAWGIYHTSATNVTIDGCVMNNLGQGGVSTVSGDTTTLTSHNTVIKNCHISDIARDYQANDIAAVRVNGGCGTVVKNNTFHNMKNSAIRYSGSKHLFKENEIFNAVNDANDAGAIYSGRRFAEYGSKVERNYLYWIGGRSYDVSGNNPVAGIFWDDIDSGEAAIGNIFATSSTSTGAAGVTVAGGADMVVEDNIFVNMADTNTTAKAVNAGDRNVKKIFAGEINSSTGKNYDPEKDFFATEAFCSYKDAWKTQFTGTYAEISKAMRDDYAANGTANWKEAYVTDQEIAGRIESMFDSLVKKKYIRRNVYQNNFAYKTADSMAADMTIEGDSTYKASTTLSKSDFVNVDDYDFRLKSSVNLPEGSKAITEATQLSDFGAQDYAIAAEEKEFDLVFPAKKATVLGTSTYIKWEKVNVADEYNYVVSKNADLSSPIASGKTTNTMVEIKGLEADTTYYWSVEAVNLSFNIGGTYACNEKGEFKTATYEFTNPVYDATTQNVTVDYVNAGTKIEKVNFIAAVKVGGKLMSSAVSVQDVVVSNNGTITIPASTLTSLADEGAVLELYIWDKGMKSLTGKMLLDI